MTQVQFSKAYESHFHLTVRFLGSKGVPRADAEEVAQAAWAKGWEKRAQLRNKKMVGTWVNSIALNMLRNCLQRDSKNQELFEIPDRGSQPSSAAAKVDLERMLANCDAVDQSLLVMHYVVGYTTAEAGEKHGLKPTATRVRLMRARDRLKGDFARARSNRRGRAVTSPAPSASKLIPFPARPPHGARPAKKAA